MKQSFLIRYKLHYIFALSAFAVWMIFFDEKDIFTQGKRTADLKQVESKIDFYKIQIAETWQQIDQLDNDPGMLEKFAREKYYMKRDNEEVFIIDLEEVVNDNNN